MSYRKKSIILAPCTAIGLGIIWMGFEIGSPILSYIGGGFTGLFAYPLLTTLTDFATQTTFPVG
jgi:hypothetical protein